MKVGANGELPNVRVISLKRCAVFARFVKQRASCKDAPGVRDQPFERQLESCMLGAGLCVDEPALGVANQNVAVGVENFGGKRTRPLKQAAARKHRRVGRALVPIRSFKRERWLPTIASEQVDNSSKRVRSIQA